MGEINYEVELVTFKIIRIIVEINEIVCIIYNHI